MTLSKDQQFAFRASPLEWQDYAIELMETANRIFQAEPSNYVVSEDPVRGLVARPGYSRPYLLLVAFALENQVKGLAVARHPELVADGRIAKRLQTHKFTDLADGEAGITLSDDERQLCEILQSSIPSWGRYPVPRTISNLAPEVQSSPELKARIDNLFRRLDAALTGAVRNGWNGPHQMAMGEATVVAVKRR